MLFEISFINDNGDCEENLIIEGDGIRKYFEFCTMTNKKTFIYDNTHLMSTTMNSSSKTPEINTSPMFETPPKMTMEDNTIDAKL